MPTRPTKGTRGESNEGSHKSGAQKATYGSAVSADVADQRRRIEHDEQRDAAVDDEADD